MLRYRLVEDPEADPSWEVVLDSAALIADKVDASLIGAANGVASLDADAKLPVSQLPTSAMQYQGFWNASSNDPTLVDGVGDPGDVYRVTVAGTRDLGSGSQAFNVGDQVICNSLLIWEKGASAGAVDTVFGRTGAVVAADADYTASQVVVNPSGLVVITGAATRVQSAIAELDASYRIDTYLVFQGDATADLKLGFTMPAGTMHLTVEGALTTVAGGSDYDRFLTLTSSGSTTVVGVAGAATPISVRVSGVIHPTADGTFALIWSPNVAGAGTGITRLARSQLYYRAA